MNVAGSTAPKFNVTVARQYMQKAKREGRTEKDGISDYLAALGFSRPEEEEAFMQKFSAENRELTERIMANLEEIRQIARTAQKQYTGA